MRRWLDLKKRLRNEAGSPPPTWSRGGTAALRGAASRHSDFRRNLWAAVQQPDGRAYVPEDGLEPAPTRTHGRGRPGPAGATQAATGGRLCPAAGALGTPGAAPGEGLQVRVFPGDPPCSVAAIAGSGSSQSACVGLGDSLSGGDIPPSQLRSAGGATLSQVLSLCPDCPCGTEDKRHQPQGRGFLCWVNAKLRPAAFKQPHL